MLRCAIIFRGDYGDKRRDETGTHIKRPKHLQRPDHFGLSFND